MSGILHAVRAAMVFFVLTAAWAPASLRAQHYYFPPLSGTAWDTVAPSSLGWNTGALDSLYSYLEANNTKAFLLLKDGRLAVEWYFGAFQRDSAWYWASAGKTLTAFLVGIAQREGALSIGDSASKWLGAGWTSAPAEKETLITVRHQLTMSSGLNDAVPDPYCTDPACLQYLADAGSRWAYHNGPYTLLDGVITSATGLTLNQFFVTRMRFLTGMTGGFFPSGYNNVFVSIPRSMARFGLLVLNRGRWGMTEVLGDSVYFEEMINTSQPLNLSYGYLWWLNGKTSYRLPQTQIQFPGPLSPSAPPDMFSALGKNGQFINVVPGMGVVMVRMGDAPDSALVPFLLNDQIWERLRRVMRTTTGIPVREGWNLLSVPLTVDDATAAGLFPTAVSGAYGFDSAYVTRTLLRNGEGYWVKFGGGETVAVTGWPRSLDTLELAAGWNLIGSIADTVETAIVVTIPSGVLASDFYGFGAGGYEPAVRLLPGNAYWIKCASRARLILCR